MFRLFTKRDSSINHEEKTGVDIKSVELLLSITQNEYSNEFERNSMMQSKAGIALPIIAAYFLTLSQMNDYRSMFQIPVNAVWDSLLPLGLCISYSVSLFFAILSLVFIALSVFAKGYKRINPQSFCTEANLSQEYLTFAKKLMHQYFDAIDHNAKANDRRMKMYKQSWTFSLVSVACFLVYLILKNNM